MIKNFDGENVLVTGGAGFIGSHLVDELVGGGARVTVVDDLSSGNMDNLAASIDRVNLMNVNLVSDDIGPLFADGRFAMVFHLAGHAVVPASVERPREDFERNLLGTLNVLEQIRSMDKRPAVVFTSSAAVYGEGSGEQFRECDATAPIAPYGVSKLAAERYMAVYALNYGLETAVMRLFPIFGPRLRKHVVFDLISKLHANPDELLIHGDGHQVRDFSHVSTVVAGFMAVAAGAEFKGETYNVGSGETCSIRELAQMISERMNLTPRYTYTGDVKSGISLRWTADLSRLKAIGFKPRLGLGNGLRDTLEWFNQNVAGVS